MFLDFNLLNYSFLVAALSAFLLGIAKAGVKGIAALIVTGFAIIYGAKESTGILMPLLICGDIFAVLYYKRYVKWIYILKLIPWMIFGVLIGVVIGNNISEKIFQYGMALIIIFSVSVMYYWDSKKNNEIPNNFIFAPSMGILSGFATMIGNLAGAFSNIYFLAMRLPKNEFIGTSAWLFFIINVFKTPFHLFFWETITLKSLIISSKLVPFVIIGLLTGVFVVKKIENENYRKLILILTAIGGIGILFK
jgi:uncharacterized membrane protein YfcA